MTVRYDVEVKGLQDLRHKLKLVPILATPLRAWYKTQTKEIEKEAKQVLEDYEKIDTKKLYRSIKATPIADKGRLPNLAGVVVTAPYAEQVHGKMKRNVKMTPPWTRTAPRVVPLAQLRGWSRRKGLTPEYVQRSIATKGTPIVPFLKIAVKKTKGERETALQLVALEMERRWSKKRVR